MADHIRVSMCFPRGQLAIGISLLASVLQKPSFAEPDLSAALRGLERRRTTLWETALMGTASPPGSISAAAIRRAHAQYFQPQNITIGVGGAIEPGEAEALLAKRTAGWPARPSGEPPRDPRASGSPAPQAGLRVIELAAPLFSASDAAFATRLLSVCAVGVGKGSAMFKILREKNGWSYRQEAFLWPAPGGFRPRMLMATALDNENWTAAVRDALLEEVKSWKEEDLKRARALLASYLELGLGQNPIYVTPHGPLSEGVEAETFELAYWTMKTGRPLDKSKLLAQLGHVRLEELKETAAEQIERSIGVVRTR